MADPATLTDLLLTHSEAKLQKLHDGIVAEIERLGVELRVVDEALAKKRRAKSLPEVAANGTGHGRANDLSRTELYRHLLEYDRPAKPASLARYLATKGIVRRPEAVRNGLVRLERDGKVTRNADGYFVAVDRSGGKVEADTPEAPGASLKSPASGAGV